MREIERDREKNKVRGREKQTDRDAEKAKFCYKEKVVESPRQSKKRMSDR